MYGSIDHRQARGLAWRRHPTGLRIFTIHLEDSVAATRRSRFVTGVYRIEAAGMTEINYAGGPKLVLERSEGA